jgi:hypothetical protein
VRKFNQILLPGLLNPYAKLAFGKGLLEDQPSFSQGGIKDMLVFYLEAPAYCMTSFV